MSVKFGFNLSAAVLALALVAVVSASASPHLVPAATKPGAEWKDFPTRTLDDLPAVAAEPADSELSQYGGSLAHKETATGFFHTAKVGNRWWLVDPDGSLFLNVGVASVKTISTPGAKQALTEKFADQAGWAESSIELLRTNGFNGIGAWSEDEVLNKSKQRVTETRMLGFMAGYAKIRGGTHMQPGHLGYPNDCIFVFDPAFENFCDTYAQQLSKNKNDPWLIGYFSDNEMPFPRRALTNFFGLPPADPGHQTALQFLRLRHGMQANLQDITAKDEQDFLSLVAGKYFETVSRAIRKYDPNHLYLGCRFYAADIAKLELFKACGPFVDVVSMNYYRTWTPEAKTMQIWARESGKPIMITEWYAKAVDSGMPNNGGAGWLVKTQRERGLFYQNFTLALIESKVCVGWHWFRYSDNDLDDKSVDPSNRDSNKGIVNNRYEPYAPLLEKMKPLNEHIYSLADYFDGVFTNHADRRSPGEKGD